MSLSEFLAGPRRKLILQLLLLLMGVIQPNLHARITINMYPLWFFCIIFEINFHKQVPSSYLIQ